MIKKNILLIGCGNIGFRHIELLIKDRSVKNIYIYDINLNNSKKLIDKFDYNIKIILIKNLNLKLRNLFLCIISTHSNRRFYLMSKIIRLHNPKYILVEKLIENNIYEINKYYKELEKKKIYVNCSNRLRTIFIEIKKRYYKKKINMEIKGGNWNLLSNCIHFIDFLAFITNEKIKKIKIKKNSYLTRSKHNKYKELIGGMIVEFDKGSVLKLNSTHLNKDKINKINDNNNYKTVANLDKNKISYPNKKKFKSQYQSQLTYKVYKCLTKGSKINLPNLKKNIEHTKIFLNEIKRDRLFKYKKDIMIT